MPVNCWPGEYLPDATEVDVFLSTPHNGPIMMEIGLATNHSPLPEVMPVLKYTVHHMKIEEDVSIVTEMAGQIQV